MKMKAENAEDLGEALKQDADEIEIDVDLEKKVIRIKGVGKVAWAICIAAMTTAIVAIIATPATGGAAAPVAGASAFVAAPIAVATLGAPAASAAVTIAVAAGSVGALNKLRKYNIIKRNGKTFLVKK